MHIPVLLNEVLQYLDPKPGDNFIDCTVGEGGHALAILKLNAPHGKVLGIDRDAEAAMRLRERISAMGMADRLIIRHGNFSDLGEIVREENFPLANGVLFDFGMSSWQLEESGAGFSFRGIEPLDMRFDRTRDSETAASIVNSWPEEAIYRILHDLGEERYARRIAKEIVVSRRKRHIETTDQLVEIISKATAPRRFMGKTRKRGGIHFATRVFQALRIAVNDEFQNIDEGLREAISILSPGGRIVAISFHSLEDRRVKNIFKSTSAKATADEKQYSKVEGSAFVHKGLALSERSESKGSLRILTKKPIVPSDEEIRNNPRARSAKMRVAERLKFKT